jgi:bifunctional enzyme CysN/CysC
MLEPSNQAIDEYLAQQSSLELLRFITCGSVDDGKSTLIGRMLYEAQLIFDDQVASLQSESRKHGTQGEEIDFALLVDGLAAEREQGITIDMAYRFFSTNRRKFIVADTPGHEEYTRNMVTGASTAEVAVILIDASQGMLEQTQRHSFIVSLLGIKQVVLAINKMDLVNFDQAVFDKILQDYQAFAASLAFESITAIPLSALKGDNVIVSSDRTRWYNGPTLLGFLEQLELGSEPSTAGFYLPVQWVNRASSDFRGYAGTVAAGKIEAGDEVRALPSGQLARIDRIILGDQLLGSATAGRAVTVTLDKEIDLSRGDVLCAADAPCEVSDQFEVSLVWMHKEPGYVGRFYWLMLGTARVGATITGIKYQYNINTLAKLSANELQLNEIAEVSIKLDRAIPFTPYAENRALGGFVFIDRYDYATVAAGMINFSLRRASNIHQQALMVDRAAREALNGQRARVFWLTGLSGSGKSTIANAFEQALYKRGLRTYILDGDNVRHGLNQDLGFTNADRIENIRRVAEVAKLMLDAGVIVVAAFISPFRPERDAARQLFADGDFVEVFVDAPLKLAEQRDTKGLYKKARRGELPNFTGIDSDYEAPLQPDVRLATGDLSVQQSVQVLLDYLDES